MYNLYMYNIYCFSCLYSFSSSDNIEDWNMDSYCNEFLSIGVFFTENFRKNLYTRRPIQHYFFFKKMFVEELSYIGPWCISHI